MGRHYSGDIEGKFWFAVQRSNAADRFGSFGTQHYLNYYFDNEHLKKVKAEIALIKKKLGNKVKLIAEITKSGYTTRNMVDNKITDLDMENYADLKLGIKIRNCIVDTGSCSFEAEL